MKDRIYKVLRKHKTEFIIALLICIVFFMPRYTLPKKPNVEIDAKWDTSTCGEIILGDVTPDEPVIQIQQGGIAKLDIEVDVKTWTSNESTINIYCESAKKDSGIKFVVNGYTYNDNLVLQNKKTNAQREIYKFSILIIAPLNEDIFAYRIEVHADVNSTNGSCKMYKLAWIRVLDTTELPIFEPRDLTVVEAITFFIESLEIRITLVLQLIIGAIMFRMVYRELSKVPKIGSDDE